MTHEKLCWRVSCDLGKTLLSKTWMWLTFVRKDTAFLFISKANNVLSPNDVLIPDLGILFEVRHKMMNEMKNDG